MEIEVKREQAVGRFIHEDIEIGDVVERYQPRDGDVFAVGPAKSGTTWLQQILHQLRTKGDESFKDIYEVTCFMMSSNGKGSFNVNSEQVCNPRIYKIHFEYGEINMTLKQKYIFVVRDPYDAVHSYMKFENRWYGKDTDFSEENLMKKVGGEEKTFLCNFDFLASWWMHRNDPNVLIIFYEDMVKNLQPIIKRIADFIEIQVNDEELSRIVYLSSFEYMSKNKEKFQGNSLAEKFAKNIGMESWTPKMGMVREDGGKVGQGSKITQKLKEMVDIKWADVMKSQFGFDSYSDMYRQHSFYKK